MKIVVFALLFTAAFAAPFPCQTTKYQCVTSADPLTGDSGLFSDGSGEQDDYKNDMKHCIKIAPSQIPGSSRVKLTLQRKDVEANFDWVILYDLDGDKCLDDDADVETSYYSKKGFVVFFVTDNSITKKGFAGKYAVESSTPTTPTVEEVSLNAYFTENHKASHTDKFQNAGRLMIRRGQQVQFSLSNRLRFKNLRMMLQGSDMKNPYVLLPDGSNKDGFKLEKQDEKYVLTVPVTAPVGIWTLDCILEDGKVLAENMVMYLLFNPWNNQDQVYMSNTAQIAEYVENAGGALWTGEYGKPFQYSFYDAEVIKGVMKVLDGLSAADRKDVVKVARYISWRANNDVLHGRWDGKYSDGKEPSFWNDIGVIIRQWSSSGVRVKYGQCWVFSGVVLTISRGLGIPNRSVTNINSAHEHQPFDQKCTQKWVQKGTSWEQYDDDETDSVWNFHVWNEGMFRRDDLNPGRPVEWNAYDGTCQEMSDGKCQCGPANVPLIREKQYQKYDSAFIAGETDCQLNIFTKPEGASAFKLLRTDECQVGAKTLTRRPNPNNNRNDADDVSLGYKKDEKCRGLSFIEMYELDRHTVHSQGQLKFEIDLPPKSVKIDQSLDAAVIVNGVSAKDIVSVSMKVDMTNQKGEVLPDSDKQSSSQKPQDEVKGKENKRQNAMPSIWTFSKVADITGSRAVVKASVDPTSYLKLLGKSRFVRISVTVNVANSKNEQYGFYVQSKQVTLKIPDLKVVSVPNGLKAGAIGSATVSWKNVLPFPVKNAKLSYSYTGSGTHKLEVVQFEIPAGADAVFKVQVKGVTVGRNNLAMSLIADEVNNIGGSADYTVAAVPSQFKKHIRLGELTGRKKVGITSEEVGRKKATAPVHKTKMGKISQAKGAGGQVNHLKPNAKGSNTKVDNSKVKKASKQVNAKVRVANKDQKKDLQPKKTPPKKQQVKRRSPVQQKAKKQKN